MDFKSHPGCQPGSGFGKWKTWETNCDTETGGNSAGIEGEYYFNIIYWLYFYLLTHQNIIFPDPFLHGDVGRKGRDIIFS